MGEDTDLLMGGPAQLSAVRKEKETSDDEWETESDVSSTGNFQLEQDLSDMDDDSADETKSRFTDYSMTSSVIRRTQGLKILDDRFERIMEEYDEEEIGAVDHEEMTGPRNVNCDLMTHIVEEFIQDHTKIPFGDAVDESAADEKLFKEFEKKEKAEWDCESIISTYSNLYNHPKIIDEPKIVKLHPRSGIPLGVLKDSKTAKKEEGESDDEESCEQVVLNNIRSKNETVEERRARKHEVKKMRAERRKEKKENKTFFKDEHRKQEQISMNRSNLIAIP